MINTLKSCNMLKLFLVDRVDHDNMEQNVQSDLVYRLSALLKDKQPEDNALDILYAEKVHFRFTVL